jgi:N-sulfoglucosamine sulfohydrolase
MTHFISGIDYMPTVLEAAGIQQVQDMDGASFLPLLEGDEQPWRTSVFTEINTPFSGISLHMRAIQNKDFGYIYNPFSGHEKVDVEGNDGPSWDAMVEAGKSDTAIQERVDLFSNRVPEELYHYKTDPDALINLILDPDFADVLEEMRQELADEMLRTDDFMLERFEQKFRIKGASND